MMEVSHFLKTKDGHQLAVYQKGNPHGPAVVYLHGGPGGSISERIFEYFDLTYWRVIAFDQRGCGNSLPFASLENNTIQDAVVDMEQIRHHYKLDTWSVFGGSYGSTLALAYAIDHPDQTDHLILRGVFLGRDDDVAWLYQEGASYFYPSEHQRFKDFIAPNQQNDLVNAYYEIFKGDDDVKKREAAKIWADWENSVVTLLPNPVDPMAKATPKDVSLALLECHFFANHMFWTDDNWILNQAKRIATIPTTIVHGRYDVDCRLKGAYDLANSLQNCTLIISESSGHSGFEPQTMAHLKAVMETLKR